MQEDDRKVGMQGKHGRLNEIKSWLIFRTLLDYEYIRDERSTELRDLIDQCTIVLSEPNWEIQMF